MTAVALMLVLAAVAAWWGTRRSQGAIDYFAAGHRAGAWLVGVAGTAAALSAFTFIGGPGLFWSAGAGSLWLILSAPVTGALQCWAVGETVHAMVERNRVVTLPALIGVRFGSRSVQGFAALIVAVGCVASLAVQAQAAVVLGRHFLGLSPLASAGLIIGATTFYTAWGGMRAGLLADAVQGTLMAVIAVLLAGAAVRAAGGFQGMMGTLISQKPQLLGAFGTVPPARAVQWYLLYSLGTLAQPHYLQKFMFLRDRKQFRRLPAVLTLALVVTLLVWIGLGFAGTALVGQGRLALQVADDLAPGTVSYLGPWAVLLAGIATLAALMSTAASFLNLFAAAVTRDLPEAFQKSALGLRAAAAATVTASILSVAVGLASGRTVAFLGLLGWGFFTAALLPVLTVGLGWRGTSPAGVVAAILVGAGLDLVLETFRNQLPGGMEPGLVGAAVGVLVLVLGSSCSGLSRKRSAPKGAGS